MNDNKDKLNDLKRVCEELERLYSFYTEQVKYYENQRRLLGGISEFYKRSYQTQIHRNNAKRELIKYLLLRIGDD
jgi:hypothetical protein